jgi:STE24 endopeptidase
MDMILNSTTLILLFLAVYLVDVISSFLNLKKSEEPLPAQLQDLQSAEAQAKASKYLKDRIGLGTIKDGFFLFVFVVILKSGFFDRLATFSNEHASSVLGQSLIFAGVLIFGQGILSIPFSAYSTFKIEAQYGFNRTTVGTFLGDLLKGVIVGAILGGLLFSFVVTMLQSFGNSAWFAMWTGYTVFQFFIVWIAPVTILPLFMKLTPLKEGPLLTAIDAYSLKQSFKLNGVWICDASKRSAKSNAFFTGFGKFRRLVLFDTLIEKHPPEEIVAIVAHEAGHFKLGHIWKMSLTSAVSSLAFFFVVQKLLESPSLYTAFETDLSNSGIGLVLAGIVLSKALFFFSPIRSYFSRRNEYAADKFSVDTTGDAPSLVSGLKRLVTENMATLQHHPLYVILNDSHPPLPDRLKPWL